MPGEELELHPLDPHLQPQDPAGSVSGSARAPGAPRAYLLLPRGTDASQLQLSALSAPAGARSGGDDTQQPVPPGDDDAAPGGGPGAQAAPPRRRLADAAAFSSFHTILGHSRKYLAACVVGKNEGRHLHEWIQYHRWIGFSKFYVFDHNSTRLAVRRIADYMRQGVVEYIFFAGHHGAGWAESGQGYAYDMCLRMAMGRHTWMSFHDPDEYIVLKGALGSGSGSGSDPPKPDFAEFLRSGYEQYPALGINWIMFGSGGHMRAPQGLSTLQAYTKCMSPASDVHKHVKLVVHLPKVVGLGHTPHDFRYVGGARAVNELGAPFAGPFSEPPTHSKVALHHYFTRSLEDFMRKASRGRGTGTSRAPRKLKDFLDVDTRANADCGEGPALWARCCAAPAAAARAGAARGRLR